MKKIGMSIFSFFMLAGGAFAQDAAGEKSNWLDVFTAYVTKVDDFVWGVPLICLILFGGLYLTIRLCGMQFVRLPRALRYMVKNEESGKGEVSSFAALCTALSATIGTGNIVGVATAVVAGGPGALFWMWMAALFGMATKYSEGLLAVKYRDHDPKTGHALGGPFYYIERGMGMKWRWLAKLFAFFGVLVGLLGIGTFTQVNSITGSVNGFAVDAFGEAAKQGVMIFGNEYPFITVACSIFLAFLVGLVVIGGIKRIATVSTYVIPAMVLIYVLFAVILICVNFRAVPDAFYAIIKGAFNPETKYQAAAGGTLGAVIVAMQKGIARGIFSNEAGLGSAPIAAAAAKTNEPVRQGLVSMTGTFLDTIIVCSMTGLAIVLCNGQETGLNGATVTTYSFQQGLPFFNKTFVSGVIALSMVLFGFTTILGWDYYSERCLEYLTNGSMLSVKIYRWCYILAVFIGPYMTISAVWGIADICNGLMALPNMIALLALSGVIARETKDYFRRLRNGEIKED